MPAFLERRDSDGVFLKPRIGGGAMLVVVFLMAFLAIHAQSYFGDEGFHFEQLRRFHEGDFSIDYELTMLPGYHALLGSIAWLTGFHSLNFYRLLNIVFSLLSIAVFRAILLQLHPNAGGARVVQYAFLPILFPYFFFLFTDSFSVLVVLLSMWMLLKRRYAAAGLLGIASMLVRQTNIIWFFCFFLVFLWEQWPGFLRMLPAGIPKPERLRALLSAHRSRIRRGALLVSAGVFCAGFLLFLAFVVWNHGIAVGDKESHPFPSFHAGNIFFCLFLSFFLFLPLHLSNAGNIIRRLRTSRLLGAFLVVVFLLYLITFMNDHWYNQGLDSIYFRNRILAYFTSTPSLKLLFFLPIGYSLLSLATVRLSQPLGMLLYPMSVLYLLPSWLIEQRYYFIPMALFLVLRQSKSNRLETLSAVYSVLCAILLFIPITLRWFFL